MSKLVRVGLALTLIGTAAFAAFRFTWNLGMRDPAENLQVAQCPISEAERLMDYHIAVSGLIQDLLEVPQSAEVDHGAIAQRYRALAIELEGYSHPDCAQLLHEVLLKAINYEARAQAALEGGGIFSDLVYQYYHMLSIDNLYLVPFITRMIDPPLPINDGRLHA